MKEDLNPKAVASMLAKRIAEPFVNVGSMKEDEGFREFVPDASPSRYSVTTTATCSISYDFRERRGACASCGKGFFKDDFVTCRSRFIDGGVEFLEYTCNSCMNK